MKEPDHFKASDLKRALLASGLAPHLAEIQAIDNEIMILANKRHNRLQEMLQDVKRVGLFKFRPCHAKRIETLKVNTEFWMV